MDTDNEPVEVIESPTTVTLPDPEPANDDDTNDVAPANDNASPEERQTARREKRAGRTLAYKEQQTRAADAERRLAAADAERQRMAEQIAELRGRTEAIQQQQRVAQPDPHEKQVADLEAKSRRHLATAAAAKDQATADAELNEYHRTQRQAAVLEARRDMQQEMQRFSRNQPDPTQAGMKVALDSEFPWLGANVSARNAADAYIALLISRDKKPNNLATYREACAMAARDFGLGGTAERPSEGRRAAYNGIPSRTGAGGEGGATQLRMSTDDNGKMKIMARQLYPHLDQEDAYKKWLKDVAPGLVPK